MLVSYSNGLNNVSTETSIKLLVTTDIASRKLDLFDILMRI